MKKISNLKHFLFASLLLIQLACNKEESPEPAPNPPSNLKATTISSSQIDLSWDDNSDNETGFKIERKSGSEDYVVITTSTKNVSTFSDTNLEEFIEYSYRIFAFNANYEFGEYSNETTAITFGKAVLGISEVKEITPFSATFENNVIEEKGSQVMTKGVVWSTVPSPTIDLETKTEDGSGLGNYSSEAIGLNWETEYYVRSYATNGAGTSYGQEISFSTSAIEITTSTATDINHKAAVSGGFIGGEGGTSILARGVIWDVESNPTIDLSTKTENSTGTGNFISSIRKLLPNTKYYVRAYASNDATTSYATEISFITGDGVADVDGNSYPIVTIGTQVWMAENLKTTKFSDGTDIPEIIDPTEWTEMTNAGFSWYDHDREIYGEVFGGLYNWYAVNEGNVCPVGWHVATPEEWLSLIDFLGGREIAGGKLKEIGTEHWDSPNSGASDEVGFRALGAGYRSRDGSIVLLKREANWWAGSTNLAFGLGLTNESSLIAWGSCEASICGGDLNYGRSVRCLKD